MSVYLNSPVRLILSVISLCALTETAAAQSRKDLVAAVRQGCRSSRAQIETQALALRRKQTAFQVLLTDWKEKTPAHLRENLPVSPDAIAVELHALKVLGETLPSIDKLLKLCEEVPDEADPATIAQLSDVCTHVHDRLRQLQDRWKQQPETRAAYKSSLNRAIDLLSEYNVSKLPTYITVKVELNPDIIDQEIGVQDALLTTVTIGFSVLQ